MRQNYIFDLYGTLVDIETNEDKPALWKKTARLYALQGAFYLPSELKKRYRELVHEKEERLAEETGVPRPEAEIRIEEVFRDLFSEKGVAPPQTLVYDMGLSFRNESIRYIRLYPGVQKLLNRLRQAGKGIYLLSNAQRIFTEAEMRMLGIYDRFDGILYSSDAGVKKPSPLFYEALHRKFGLRKEESVMTGNDCSADAWGAHAFGIPSMYVHTKCSPPLAGPLPSDCKRLQEIGEVFPG